VLGAIACELDFSAHRAIERDLVRALDNLSAAADGRPRPHEDLLPFPREPLPKP
jgi:hypothetical protein